MDKLLSEFVHDVVIDSKKSDLLSATVGKSRNTLLNELNPENLSNKAGMDLLLPVMEKCDPEDRIMHALARTRGGVFIRLLAVDSADDCRKQFMDAMGELGALVRSFEHARDEAGPHGAKVGTDELAQFEAQAQAALTGLQKAVMACRAELKHDRGEVAMKTLAERVAAVEVELRDIVANAQFDRTMQTEIGKLSMASHFLTRIVEERLYRKKFIARRGGMDLSVPLGDR